MLGELVNILADCRRCAVLTGAGMSAESGVPTFRGKEGLWHTYRPEELATAEAFEADSRMVWEWYNWRRQLIGKVRPNPGHRAITDLEGRFEHFALITQNVDGLHKTAGTKNILELHGNINDNKCFGCGRSFDADVEIDPECIPACPDCGGKIRPDVVWFGETLDSQTIQNAFHETERADVFFSVGTSAVVHPAASLPVAAKQHGATLVEINPDPTPLSGLADFYFPAKSGELLPQLVEELVRKIDAE